MRKYKRTNCEILVQDEAEELLKFNNVSIDSFVNHLYLFTMDQPLEGKEKIYVYLSRYYTGKAHFSIGFGEFKLPLSMVPKLPEPYLTELKEDNPEAYAEIQALNANQQTSDKP